MTQVMGIYIVWRKKHEAAIFNNSLEFTINPVCQPVYRQGDHVIYSTCIFFTAKTQDDSEGQFKHPIPQAPCSNQN